MLLHIGVSFRDKIALGKAAKGQIDYTMWGLGKIRGFCYHRVYAMDKKMFEEFMEEFEILR